jgi:hypothetical protein
LPLIRFASYIFTRSLMPSSVTMLSLTLTKRKEHYYEQQHIDGV